MTRKK